MQCLYSCEVHKRPCRAVVQGRPARHSAHRRDKAPAGCLTSHGRPASPSWERSQRAGCASLDISRSHPRPAARLVYLLSARARLFLVCVCRLFLLCLASSSCSLFAGFLLSVLYSLFVRLRFPAASLFCFDSSFFTCSWALHCAARDGRRHALNIVVVESLRPQSQIRRLYKPLHLAILFQGKSIFTNTVVESVGSITKPPHIYLFASGTRLYT